MTKSQFMARLVLIILGIYLLVCLLDIIRIPVLNYVSFRSSVVPRDSILLLGLACLIPFVIVYYLLFRSDVLVKWMVPSTNDDDNAVNPLWIAVGFRAAFFLCGILTITGSVYFLVRVIGFVIYGPRIIVEMFIYKYIDGMFRLGIDEWLRLVVDICRLTLGIYLILGAPQFLRWQTRQIAIDTAAKDVEGKTQECHSK